MDSGWGGDVEVLLVVDGRARQQGVGSYILERLEQEAVGRGVNYVYNTVRDTHPDRELLHDWLAVRGYRGGDGDRALRKRVTGDTGVAYGRAPSGAHVPVPSAAAQVPAPSAARDSGGAERTATDRGPGHEEAGGYVAVEDHRY